MKDISYEGYDEAVEIIIHRADMIYKLYDYIHFKLSTDVDKRLLIVHIKCFIEPYMVIALAKCFIYIKHLNHNNMILVIPSDSYKKYLNDIGLVDFCRANYEEPKMVPFIASKTAMGLWRINSSNMDQYSIEIDRYLGKYYKNNGIIKSCICELANNVCDHSESPIDAYIFCQYYPSSKSLQIVVGDMGIGIPNRIRTKEGFENKQDHDAILWALQQRNSTESRPHNRGLGLDTIKSDVLANEGDLSIYSGNCHYKLMQNGQEEFRQNSIENFKGTIISIILNTNNIQKEEVLQSVPDWD